jgi:tetratricopeptide (TPR) repeat protein
MTTHHPIQYGSINMTSNLSQISAIGRKAVQSQDWHTVAACANEILRQDRNSAEGYFLTGLVDRVSQRSVKAARAFEKVLELDSDRYDAAVELASLYSIARRNGDVAKLLAKYEDKLGNSPMYLDFAGTIYTGIGMHLKAWPLFKKAVALQPGVDLFQANFAACSVFLGKIEDAQDIYRRLLKRFPNHRKNHYELARLGKAKDTRHIEQMKEVLRVTDDTPDKNIYLYYALAKEYEDLEQWEQAFEYYKKAGDAVTSVANYDVAEDIAIIDKVIEVCNADWLAAKPGRTNVSDYGKTPIFIVGLPRTGTTLTERIVSSHSQVASIGETLFLQMMLRQESGIQSIESMNPEMIEAVAKKDIELIARGYLDKVSYRFGNELMFIDKLPWNVLYLGFIAKAWPNAKIISLVRNPMDSCFSMYKQVFTWAYKFSYSLDGLGKYFVAYDRLCTHWRELLKDRLIEVEYELLVNDQENQTRILLDKLGLEFEQACLDFEKNKAPIATASSVQARGKVNNQSVNKWTRFARQLQPLKEHLEKAGIKLESHPGDRPVVNDE